MVTLRKTMRHLLASSALAGLPFGTLCAEALEPGAAPPVVTMPAGANTEAPDAPPVPAEGFLIRVDDAPFMGDTGLAETSLAPPQRRADRALADADIQVRFDGLGVVPRLDAQILGDGPFEPGQAVTFQSRLNYPAFVSRGEIRVLEPGRRGGLRTLKVIEIDPNGRATATLPDSERMVFVHRVYDARGQFDETVALPVTIQDERGLADGEPQEEGSDATARRAIPVRGGAVTVFGEGLPAGTRVATLGDRVEADPAGRFVLQRVLPAGEHAVSVNVAGAGDRLSFVRDIEIPRSEWFYVGTVDLTYGWRFEGGKEALGGAYDDTYSHGRLAFYAKGKTQNGTDITASADTGEEELEDIFRKLDEKDPRSLLRRIDPDDYYPTYGDDSVAVDDTPTSGRFYLRVEKAGNMFLWGTYQSRTSGTEYLRNERTLYGAQAVLQSQALTDEGAPRLRFEGYAAQPESLPQRDVLRGTGGSVYFLTRQDISVGSETVSIEIRDPDTGRVLERRPLTYGADYDINYVQGVVTLSRPLTSSSGGGLITVNPNGDNEVALAVQYEWTPSATDVDGYAYGGRVEAWLTDDLRIGVTGQVERTGDADQEAYGADLLWQYSDTTRVELEYARTEGPGIGSTYSTDGGLIANSENAVGGNGEAFRIEGQVDLADVTPGASGVLGAYYEERDAGFSTLDFQVMEDQEYWGVFGELPLSETTELRFYYDAYSDTSGERDDEGGVEIAWRPRPGLKLEFGAEHLDKVKPGDPDDTGERIDIAMRVTLTPREEFDVYAFAQATLERSGGLDRNDRAGLGLRAALNERWAVEGEVSGGSTGPGGRALLSFSRENNDSAYFGYTLDPDRDFNGVDLTGRDRGQFVAGGTRRMSDRVTAFGENTYDLFGEHTALTSAYGVEYAHNEFLTTTAALEYGRIDDEVNGDFDRHALSLGMRYQDEALTAKGRLEYRRERGTTSGSNRDADSVLVAGTLRYKLSESARIVGAADIALTDTDQSVYLDGEFAEVSLGYAYRPIHDDRLNLLFKYRYVFDEFGQSVDGEVGRGPKQRSHILSLDGSYDVSRHWTLGGKIGGRVSESAPSGTDDFASNDAFIAVVDARWHVVHRWDLLLAARALRAEQIETTETGVVAAAYRHVGNHFKVGVGYNFGTFSDDLADLTYDDRGMFVNVIAKF